MKTLVIETIIANYAKGYDEIGVNAETDERTFYLFDIREEVRKGTKSLQSYLDQMSDRELLLVLQSQHCQMFR